MRFQAARSGRSTVRCRPNRLVYSVLGRVRRGPRCFFCRGSALIALDEEAGGMAEAWRVPESAPPRCS